MKLIAIIIILLIAVHADPNPAPTFYLRSIDDKAFFLSDELEKEQPIVLSFFATWCVPCRKEMPQLDTLSKKLTNVQFYLINVSGLEIGEKKLKEDPLKVQAMVDSLGVEIPVLMDKYAMTAEKYKATILPRLVVIDKNGMIIHSTYGYKEEDMIELEKLLRGLTIEDK